jgi:DNA ligase-1
MAFIPPMLLDTRSEPFDSADFLFEPKANGVRLLYVKTADRTLLYTRHGTDITSRFPELLTLDFPAGTTLDGEVVCYDTENPLAEDFEVTMARLNTTKASTVKAVSIKRPCTYIVFDILAHKGEPVTQLPLMVRKALLASVVADTAHIKKVLSVPDVGITLFDTIKKFELEGIVAKRKESVYSVDRRPKDTWYKIINWRYAECYIIGYRKGSLAWHVAVERGGDLEMVGTAEFGISPDHRAAFYGVAKSIIISETRDSVWIQPLLRCRIKHRGYLRSGNAMTPVFVGFIT